MTGIAVWHDTVEIGKIESLGLGFVKQSGEFLRQPRCMPRRHRLVLSHDQPRQQ